MTHTLRAGQRWAPGDTSARLPTRHPLPRIDSPCRFLPGERLDKCFLHLWALLTLSSSLTHFFCPLCKAGGSYYFVKAEPYELERPAFPLKNTGDRRRETWLDWMTHLIPHVMPPGNPLQLCPPHGYLKARSPKDELNHPLPECSSLKSLRASSSSCTASLSSLWKKHPGTGMTLGKLRDEC